MTGPLRMKALVFQNANGGLGRHHIETLTEVKRKHDAVFAKRGIQQEHRGLHPAPTQSAESATVHLGQHPFAAQLCHAARQGPAQHRLDANRAHPVHLKGAIQHFCLGQKDLPRVSPAAWKSTLLAPTMPQVQKTPPGSHRKGQKLVRTPSVGTGAALQLSLQVLHKQLRTNVPIPFHALAAGPGEPPLSKSPQLLGRAGSLPNRVPVTAELIQALRGRGSRKRSLSTILVGSRWQQGVGRNNLRSGKPARSRTTACGKPLAPVRDALPHATVTHLLELGAHHTYGLRATTKPPKVLRPRAVYSVSKTMVRRPLPLLALKLVEPSQKLL
mmetsp:Transcript_21143/g.50266  ORF Transcript_21143/g.50266 Transcript_21143/m.50266 type:complete len:329 (-) Transcript_21143:5065-6051(-)